MAEDGVWKRSPQRGPGAEPLVSGAYLCVPPTKMLGACPTVPAIIAAHGTSPNEIVSYFRFRTSIPTTTLMVTPCIYKNSYKWCSVLLISLITIWQDRLCEFELWLEVTLTFVFGSNTLRTALHYLSRSDTVEWNLGGWFSSLTAPLYNIPNPLIPISVCSAPFSMLIPLRS